MAPGAHLIDSHQRHGSERVPCGRAATVVEVNPGPVPRGAHPHAQTGHAGIPDRIFRSLHRELRGASVRQSHPLRHGSVPPFENRGHCLDRVPHGRIGKMCVLQGGRRIVVPQEPADGEDRLTVGQCDRGIRVTQIVQPDVPDRGFRADTVPEVKDVVHGTVRSRSRKHPGSLARQGVENLSHVGRQPDRAGTGLAVAKVEIAFTIVGPFEGQDFRLPASGQKKQPHNRRLQGIQELVAVEHLAEPSHLVCRQEPFAPLPAQGLLPSGRQP